MLGFKVLKLKNERDKNFHYNKNKIKKLKLEIESLLNQINDINPSEEIIKLLEFERGKDRNNLLNGYNYILENKEINKDTLKELYDILSKDLLDDYSKENMGKYYREKEVYILGSLNKGMDASLVNGKMDDLFEYINEDNDNDNDTVDTFIKSQIMHYYLVYVHPYFDVNGRTARTLSMWYQLKQNKPELILFNRGIHLNKGGYKESIVKCNKGDITPFLVFSLNSLRCELEDIISYEDTTNKMK